jgi:hypothetical protein
MDLLPKMKIPVQIKPENKTTRKEKQNITQRLAYLQRCTILFLSFHVLFMTAYVV